MVHNQIEDVGAERILIADIRRRQLNHIIQVLPSFIFLDWLELPGTLVYINSESDFSELLISIIYVKRVQPTEST